MTPAFRRLLVAVAILLLLGVLLASTAVATVLAPLAVALGVTVFTFVAVRGTRRRRRGSMRIGRTSDLPDDERATDVLAPGRPSHLRWATHWESAPPPDAVPAGTRSMPPQAVTRSLACCKNGKATAMLPPKQRATIAAISVRDRRRFPAVRRPCVKRLAGRKRRGCTENSGVRRS